jgi:peptidoglycan/xylan/chitin deacetylase (PgdA/CDA1 family)
LLAAAGSGFIGVMLRAMLFVSVIGKTVAVLLWTVASWRMAAVCCFFLPDLPILHGIFVSSAREVCHVFTRFKTDRHEVWLTIDDGPDEADTPRILDLLGRHNARATFFLIGERAARFPHLVSEILARGHDVGHHTHTHPVAAFWCATPARLRAELDDGLEALRRAGASPRWFRAPVGIKSLFLAKELERRGLRCVGWSVRSLDSISRDPARVVLRVMRAVRPGSVVLMHEGSSLDSRVRVRALELLLDQFAARGICCVLPEAGQLRPASPHA